MWERARAKYFSKWTPARRFWRKVILLSWYFSVRHYRHNEQEISFMKTFISNVYRDNLLCSLCRFYAFWRCEGNMLWILETNWNVFLGKTSYIILCPSVRTSFEILLRRPLMLSDLLIITLVHESYSRLEVDSKNRGYMKLATYSYKRILRLVKEELLRARTWKAYLSYSDSFAAEHSTITIRICNLFRIYVFFRRRKVSQKSRFYLILWSSRSSKTLQMLWFWKEEALRPEVTKAPSEFPYFCSSLKVVDTSNFTGLLERLQYHSSSF